MQLGEAIQKLQVARCSVSPEDVVADKGRGERGARGVEEHDCSARRIRHRIAHKRVVGKVGERACTEEDIEPANARRVIADDQIATDTHVSVDAHIARAHRKI